MNSKNQYCEKININKIFFEDSFIDLINKLSKTIYDYYHQSISLISKFYNIFPLFENIIKQFLLNEKNNNVYFNNSQELSKSISNIDSVKKELKSIVIKSDENLKCFLEKAKIIFKEMKEKKNNRIDEIYNDYAHKNNKIKSENIEKNKDSNLRNIDPFRISDLSKTSNNSQNKPKERNKTINKATLNNNRIIPSNNISFIKTLINKMSEYNDIISNFSLESKDNYIKLQKQILNEINKTINSNSSKSVERRNMIKPNNIPTFNTNSNNNSNNNPFIMVNNNSNNVTLTTTNNNSYYNIIDKDNLKDLKDNNSNRNSKLENINIDLNKEINYLKTQLDESKNKNKSLEKIIEESQKKIEMFKNEKNKFIKYKTEYEIQLKSLENQIAGLKKEYTIYQKKDIKNEKIADGEKFDENNLDKNINEIQLKKLKEEIQNNKTEYELSIKKLNEEMNNERKENEKQLNDLNNLNTSLSKCIADKNREIQILQNSNKLKINELNKLKLIVKNNEKQLKAKKLKADQKKANSPNNFKIKDLLASNSKNIYDTNDLNNSPNISINNDNNIINKETVSKLELEIVHLKEELEKKNEEKESLTSNISILEKDITEKNNKNEFLENELNNKNIKIEDENKLINELKTEKERLIQKLKEYKNYEELNLSQIKILKNHIKQMEKQQNTDSDQNNKKHIKKKELKKRINDLEIENANIKMQLNIELNLNCQLNNEINYKKEQIDGLNIVINKLMAEKESNEFNSNSFHSNKNNDIFNRSKTKEENEYNKINKVSNKELNIKQMFSNEIIENNKDNNLKNKNALNRKECKTDKKLEIFNFNENESNLKQNEAVKSDDAKLEFPNIKNKL